MQLKALKKDLKKWNYEIFSNVGKRKKDLVDGIRELDIIAKGRPLIEDERLRKEKISRDLERLILYEEVSWRQIKTQFLHQVANSNRINIPWIL